MALPLQKKTFFAAFLRCFDIWFYFKVIFKRMLIVHLGTRRDRAYDQGRISVSSYIEGEGGREVRHYSKLLQNVQV